MIAVPVDGSSPAIKPGVEAPLFEVALARGDWAYDVSPDGNRFLVNTPVQSTANEPMTVVVNWTAGFP